MLTKKEIIKMMDLFFNGKPEEAYKMVSSMREWDQFINSIRKEENYKKAYWIMAKSDLSIWEKHTPFAGPDHVLPFYDVGY